MGKAAFAKIEDEQGLLQIYFSRESIGEEWFEEAKKLVEVGDIISVTGFPCHQNRRTFLACDEP